MNEDFFPALVQATSPMVEGLRRNLADDPDRALAEFWGTVEALGTPLVELIPGSLHLRLVTFLWRTSGPVENVAVI